MDRTAESPLEGRKGKPRPAWKDGWIAIGGFAVFGPLCLYNAVHLFLQVSSEMAAAVPVISYDAGIFDMAVLGLAMLAICAAFACGHLRSYNPVQLASLAIVPVIFSGHLAGYPLAHALARNGWSYCGHTAAAADSRNFEIPLSVFALAGACPASANR